MCFVNLVGMMEENIISATTLQTTINSILTVPPTSEPMIPSVMEPSVSQPVPVPATISRHELVSSVPESLSSLQLVPEQSILEHPVVSDPVVPVVPSVSSMSDSTVAVAGSVPSESMDSSIGAPYILPVENSQSSEVSQQSAMSTSRSSSDLSDLSSLTSTKSTQ
jgi:hypothetical protein